MRILIWGTGKNYEIAKKYNLFYGSEIVAFVNNQEENGYFENKPLINPTQIKDFEFDSIIITSSAYDEIYYQLISLDINKNKIFYHLEGKIASAMTVEIQPKQTIPDGHFYSTTPNNEDIDTGLNVAISTKNIAGIDFNVKNQLKLVQKFVNIQKSIPFTEEKNEEYRYYFNNNAYSHGCAETLYCMMQAFKPKNIIEIGSGFSSALILDTNEKYFNSKINCTFIEPYPEENFYLRLKQEDYQNVKIYKNKLQELDSDIFRELKKNDILFIDSSHVCKTGSDVHKIIFEILPKLQKGVIIHFHDIIYPFEYPEQWLRRGIFWNEAYLLRAFLQYNEKFKILLWGSYLHNNHSENLKKMGSFLSSYSGGSIWIIKK